MARLSPLAAALLLFSAWYAARPQGLPWQSAAQEQPEQPAVRYEFPEQVSIAAGKPAAVDLHFRIRDGLHINSHQPLQKSLIRTELIVMEPSGVSIASVDFPPGAVYASQALPADKLSVYTGEFVLHAHLTARAGEHLVQAALRYQACDANACYPPRKAPVAFDLVAK
ncbi:MAG TPA: protein-disulfide reductase DsbD domain-containing protein [Acidobacteriaceae bacterium]